MVRPASTASKPVKVKNEDLDTYEHADCADSTIAKSPRGPDHQAQQVSTRISPDANFTKKNFAKQEPMGQEESSLNSEVVESLAGPEEESVQKFGDINKALADAQQLVQDFQNVEADFLNARRESTYLRNCLNSTVNENRLLAMILTGEYRCEAERAEFQASIERRARNLQQVEEENDRVQNSIDAKKKAAIRHCQKVVKAKQEHDRLTAECEKGTATIRKLTEELRALREYKQAAQSPKPLLLDGSHIISTEDSKSPSEPATPKSPEPATPKSPEPATPKSPEPATPKSPEPATPEPKTPERTTSHMAEPGSSRNPDNLPVRRLKRRSEEADGSGSSEKKQKKH